MSSALLKLLKTVAATSTHAKQLQDLSKAQNSYTAQVKKFNKTGKQTDKPKSRSGTVRTDDAVELAKLFFRYIRDSIKNRSAHRMAPKSPFTKVLQKVKGGASNNPLWFSGKLWEVSKKADEFVNNYTYIKRHKNGMVTAGFKNSFYKEISYNPRGMPAIKHKLVKVHILLKLLEGRIKFNFDPNNRNHRKILKFLWAMSGTFSNAEKRKLLEEGGYKTKTSAKTGKVVAVKLKYKIGGRGSYHPPRPFWDRAVTVFKASLNRRKNVFVEAYLYKIVITVSN